MAQVRGDMVYATVSNVVSAGDGITYDFVGPQPAPLPAQVVGATGVGSVSNPQIDMLEFMRRCMTHVTSPSATIVSGTGAAAVALTLGASPTGLMGMYQGVPFLLSGTGTPSGTPTSLMSTASNEIRKVLVCLAMSGLPVVSSLASTANATLQFTYGPTFRTSGGAVNSGGQGVSYFDYVVLPKPSANEVPVGWLNIVNSMSSNAGIVNSCMFTDYRVTQGMNFSAMLA